MAKNDSIRTIEIFHYSLPHLGNTQLLTKILAYLGRARDTPTMLQRDTLFVFADLSR